MESPHLKFYLLFFLLFMAPEWVGGQISFSQEHIPGMENSVRSGVAIGISDINGNLLDDVFRMDRNRFLIVDMQVEQGRFKNVVKHGQLSDQTHWNICSGDLNNNGLGEIATSGAFGGVFVFRQIEDGEFSVEEVQESRGFFAQTSNMVDINEDGFLDLFVCDDNSESKIFGNDGSGDLLPADHWIDMKTTPSSDNSGNYGSVWSDVSGNGKMDLYLSKCRLGASDEKDPRRVNALFVNSGEDGFAEVAQDYGIDDGGQSWAADFADINNDGYLDLFVIHHDRPSVLYLNQGDGAFENITGTAGIEVFGRQSQVQFVDFNNSGFVDLLITGPQHFLYHNNGDGTFTLIHGVLGANSIHSMAIGDLNDDGFMDLYAGYAEGINTPGSIDDLVWLNNRNANHWLKFRMNGVESNRDGIGAIVKLYSPLGIQTREVRAGESYGIQKSNIIHFGVASIETVDSVVILWPSGIRDVYLDLEVNQKLLATEGVCIRPLVNLSTTEPPILCEGETIDLMAPEGFSYQWNTGETDKSIEVDSEGFYHFRMMDSQGCVHQSETVFIREDPDLTPRFNEPLDYLFCAGDTIDLSVESGGEVSWSNGKSGNQLPVWEEGMYYAILQAKCRDFYSDTVYIDQVEVTPPVFISDTVVEDSMVNLQAEGERVKWYLSGEEEPFFEGNSLSVVLDPGSNEFLISNTVYAAGETTQAGSIHFEGTSKYHANHLNGGLIFDLERPGFIRSFKVYSDFDGPRIIEVYNEDGVLLTFDTVDVYNAFEGKRVEVDLFIPAGESHFITTNGPFNQAQTGFTSPRFFRSNQNTKFPYLGSDWVILQSSNFGPELYYYFYDLEFEAEGVNCESDLIPIQVLWDTTSTNTTHQNEPEVDLKVYPNPSNSYFYLEIGKNCSIHPQLKAFDLLGRRIDVQLESIRENTWKLDVSSWPPAIYILKGKACGRLVETRIIVMD